jgi:hypothetical protein
VEGGSTKFYHVCGLPFLHKPYQHSDASLSYFIDGLAWNHAGDQPPQRRAGFPSWSWAGWSGRVEYQHRVEKPYSKRDSCFTPLVTDVRLHYDDGSHQLEFTSWPSRAADLTTLDDAVKLEFKARKVPRQSYRLEFSMFGNWKIDTGGATLYWSLGSTNESDIHSSLVEGRSLVSVPLGNLGSFGYHYILILCRNPDGTWSRAGLFIRESFSAMSLEPEEECFHIV